MIYIFLFVGLFTYKISGMEINDNTPLLKTLTKRYDKDLEAQRESIGARKALPSGISQTYFDRLDKDITYLLTHYIEGNNKGLPLVLEKVSPNEKEAKALYEKILESHTEFSDVRKIIENIENKKTKEKLRAAVQPHEDIITQTTKNLQENKMEIIQPLFEREMGTLNSLRGVTIASKNEQFSMMTRNNIAFNGQIVNDINLELERIEKSNEFKQAYLSPFAFPTVFIFAVSVTTCMMLLIYGAIHMNGFDYDYDTCFANKTNECLANVKAYNCSEHDEPYKNPFVCCKNFSNNCCTPIATQYNNSHTPLDAWTPFIVATSALITFNAMLQLIARKCMRTKVIAPELKDLVKNYTTEIARIKALPKSV